MPYAIMGLIILSRTGSLSRGDFYPGIKKIKVMFHGTIRIDNFQRNTLSQCCNHSKQYRNNVATLCCAKNRVCESRSRITSHLNNDEGGGNGNGKKINRFRLAKQKLCTSRFFLHFFPQGPEEFRVNKWITYLKSHRLARLFSPMGSLWIYCKRFLRFLSDPGRLCCWPFKNQ